MALLYQQLLHDVAIRLSALVGTQVATIAATYDTAILTAANFKSADFPFGSVRDAILIAEEEFAWAIADTANHPWRAVLSALTSPVASGAFLPSTSSTGVPIIGVYGAVLDNDLPGEHCLEGELDEIIRIRRLLASAALTLPVRLYRIDGNRIRHTVANVVLEVCAYDRTTRLNAFNANSSTILPDVLEGPIVYRALSILTKDGAFAEQAAFYAGYANLAFQQIRAGLTSVGPKAVPVSAGEDA